MADDILSKLNPAMWRDIAFPIIGEREFSFSQETSKQRVLFRDEQLIVSIGRENPGFSYQAVFDESLYTSRWKNLFTVVYPKFLAACKDRSTGYLYDPVHGRVRAKVSQLRETLSSANRFGVTVSVEFVEAPADSTGQRPAELPIKALTGAVALGRKLDDEVEKIDWQGQKPPDKNRGLLESIQAFGDQTELFQNNVNGMLGSTAHRMERTTASIDRLKDPKTGTTRRSARRLQMAAISLADSATTPPNPVEVVSKTVDLAKFAFASLYSMTVEDLHRLNPRLQSVLLIRAGESVTVYRAR